MTRAVEPELPVTIAQRVPFDLLAVVGLALATVGLGLGGEPSPLRVVLGYLFVFLLPGYALVSALFPERPVPDEDAVIDGLHNVGGGVRLVLSVALSVFVTPIAGILHSFSPMGIALETVLPTLAAFTVVAAAAAAYRRYDRPPARRFGFQLLTWLRAAVGWLRTDGEGERVDLALNVLLALGLVTATVGLGAAVATSANGERYTAFGLLTETPTGELVARDYPETLVVGESEPLHLLVTNHEDATVSYVVVVELQRLAGATVVESTELDRLSRTLAPDGTWETTHEVTPTGELTGEDLRLTYLLYAGAPPAEPSLANAYRSAHIWVDVTGSEGA
jgi:uncharacterized membrane protein